MVIIRKDRLKPAGAEKPLGVGVSNFPNDYTKALIYTNTKKSMAGPIPAAITGCTLCRQQSETTCKGRPVSSLMFAKFSDGKKVAYVSEYNLYVEDIVTGKIKAWQKMVTCKLINGTFDWAYERRILLSWWIPLESLTANSFLSGNRCTGTKDYLMLNNTDSIYPKTVPVEYLLQVSRHQNIKIGSVDITTGENNLDENTDDEKWRTYVPRMVGGE